ncbi:MAG: protein kinase [Pyrinomonadaceae bacterium]
MELKSISHYRILEKLGAGGMGEVYLAEDTRLGRKVALKMLSAELTQNKDRLHRFEQEASTASSLNHPNILTIYEVGHEGGQNFIATEFVDGLTLRKRLVGPRLDILEVVDIAAQISSALEEAHAARIIHRDIKPENIMIRPNGIVKVLDFGLAKLTEPASRELSADTEAPTRALVHTDAGVVMGTSHYMSPEQARGKAVDPRTDIWSLGIVLYEMVAGRVPFEGETVTDVILAITKTEPPPLARYATGVPAEFEWIVMKALRKDVDDRYQTVREIHSDLNKFGKRLEFEAELERSVPPDRVSHIISTTGNQGVSTISSRQAGTATGGSSAATSHVSAGVPTRASSAEYLVTEIKRHKIRAATIAAVVLLGVASLAYFGYLRKAPALTDKDTILLADFVNTTGDPVFDGTLKQALAVQLGQSPFLNILSEERVREALRFMGRSADERVTRDIAREICERQGIKALLTGSISQLGSHYVITLEALNGRNDEAIAREQVEAESKEQVLKSLGLGAAKLREKLGESLSSIQKFDAPVEQATTSSLDALKAFSQGNDQFRLGNQLEAIPFYKRAVDLDPTFAMAYARLAVVYSNDAQTELATQFTQKAFELKDRVSERERFYISEKYYSYVVGDINEAINVLKAWKQTYPNDFVPHNNLAVQYSNIGQYEESIQECREAVRISPNNATSQGNLVEGFIRLNRYDEARQILDGNMSKNPDTFPYHYYSYQLAFLRADQATMKRDVDWFKSKQTEDESLGLESSTAMVAGQFRKALEYSKSAVEVLKSQDRKENAAQLESNIAIIGAIFGNCQEAKSSAARSLVLSRAKVNLTGAAFALAACGEAGQAQAIADELLRRYPKETALNAVFLPMIHAAMENNRGNSAQAIQLLQSTSRYDLGGLAGFGSPYLRGQAFLRQRSGPEAAAQFQKILDHRGVDPLSPLYPLAHLGLARAAVLQGDTAKARKSYQDFFALWKDADQDLPILKDAMQEYEKIK